MKTNDWVGPPKGMMFYASADLIGTYNQVCNRIKSLPLNKYWVRLDGFLHNGKEVHRIYLTEKTLYSSLEKRDVFNKKD